METSISKRKSHEGRLEVRKTGDPAQGQSSLCRFYMLWHIDHIKSLILYPKTYKETLNQTN